MLTPLERKIYSATREELKEMLCKEIAKDLWLKDPWVLCETLSLWEDHTMRKALLYPNSRYNFLRWWISHWTFQANTRYIRLWLKENYNSATPFWSALLRVEPLW